MNNSDKMIETSPRKDFFISLITRDIQLNNCILDLIDNSVDWIIKLNKVDLSNFLNSKIDNSSLSNFFIKININKDIFSISDNWSWITEEILRKYAFRFWALESDADRNYNSLWAFWIWMKRAFFKIWKKIKINKKTNNATITVNLDVDERKEDNDNWKIPYNIIEENNKETWTTIEITDLHEAIKYQAESQDYLSKTLKTSIQRSYPLFMVAWLKIYLNNEIITNDLPEIISEDKYYTTYEEHNFMWNNIDVKIVAWLIKSDKDEISTPNTSDNWRFVFCNSRNVIYWWKDYLTWWWLKWLRQFHSSLNPFIWYVFLTSKEERLLPRNTTKDWIVFDNIIYQELLNRMIEITIPIVRFLSARYKKNKDIKLLTKWKESKDIITFVQEETDNKTFSTVEKSNTEIIQYSIDKDKVLEVKEFLSKEKWEDYSNTGIWKYTFDYFYNNEIKF